MSLANREIRDLELHTNKRENFWWRVLKKYEAIRRCNYLTLSLQCSYFQEAITRNSGNMKKIWDEIRKFWPHLNKSSVKPMDHSGNATEEELANLFNHFFSNIGSELQKNIPSTNQTYAPPFAHPPIFEFHEFDMITIATAI